MELESADSVMEGFRTQPTAPAVHARTFGDDVGQFFSDLGRPGFGRTGDNVRAGFTSAVENDLPVGISDDWVMARQYEPIIEAINKVQNRQPRGWLTNGNQIENPYSEGAKLDQAHSLDYLWSQVAQERARFPGVFGQLPKSHAEVLAEAQAEQRTSAAYAANLREYSGPITGTGAQFAGQVGASAFDPFNLAATVAGFPAAESLLKTALIEGAGNAGITAVEEPGRVQHAADLGEPMTAGDAATDIGAAGIFGAGFGVGGKLIARLLHLEGHPLAEEFGKANPEPTPTQRAAVAMVQDGADLRASNPFTADAPGLAQHEQALAQAGAALDDRRPDLLPDLTEQLLPRLEPNEAEVQAAADAIAYARTKVADEPGLFQAIRDLGGIAVKDAKGNVTREGGEILALLKDRPVPGLINNKRGRTPDYMREALRERGWFGVREDQGGDIGDLYDLMGREAAGSKVYHPESAVPGQLEARAGLDEELARAGVSADDSQEVAAEKLARWRLHSADGQGSALSFWRRQADHAGVEYRATDTPEDLMASVFEAEAVRAERDGTLGLFADQAEALLRAHIDRLYPDLKDADLEQEFRDYAQREAAFGPQGEGGHAGSVGQDQGGAGRDNPGAASRREGAARDEIAASHAANTRGHDPENLKRFSDPVKKPEAFEQQTLDLAGEIAPGPEKPPAAEGEAARPSPYGEAAPVIEALERLPQDDKFADPAGGISTIKDATDDAKRQARAVERLRGCIEGGE